MEYTVSAWIDSWASWTQPCGAKVAAGQDVEIDLRGGASLAAAAAERTSAAAAADRAALRRVEQLLREGSDTEARISMGLAAETDALMRAHPDRDGATTYDPPLHVVVDPPRARFSSWYEMFRLVRPRRKCKHGTFRDAQDRLPYIKRRWASTSFTCPRFNLSIGQSYRKGPRQQPEVDCLARRSRKPDGQWALPPEVTTTVFIQTWAPWRISVA